MRSPQLHTTRQWTSFPASSASTGIPGHSAVFAAFCDVVAASGGSESALVSGLRARARTVNIHISLPHPQSTSQMPSEFSSTTGTLLGFRRRPWPVQAMALTRRKRRRALARKRWTWHGCTDKGGEAQIPVYRQDDQLNQPFGMLERVGCPRDSAGAALLAQPRNIIGQAATASQPSVHC